MERYAVLRRTIERVDAMRVSARVRVDDGLAAALRRKPWRATRCGRTMLEYTLLA